MKFFSKLKQIFSGVDWLSSIVLISTPIAAAILVPWYWIAHGFVWQDWLVFGLFMIFTGISVTAGYHRLWSHRTYKTNKFFRIFYMLFGAAALENSILKWSSDHRKHHRYVDNPEKDPYAATKGFWYSHFLWLLKEQTPEQGRIENVDDLKQDKIVMFQNRFYVPIAVLMCVGLPALIGWTYGSVLGALLLGGLLRLVLNHHFTFFINSLAHFWGKQTYNDNNTAKDNPLLSLVTYGEGYHNYHHKFAGDYRNGVRWYDFDPSKWIIGFSSKMGWAWDLKRTPKPLIEAAQAKMDLQRAHRRLEKKTFCDTWGTRLNEQYQQLTDALGTWMKARQDWLKAKQAKSADLGELKARMKQVKSDVKQARRSWRQVMAQFKSQKAIA